MLLVVLFKVIGGMGDETAQLAGEQQVCHDIAVIVGRLVGTGVADSHREGGLRGWGLQADGYLLVGGVGC